MQALGGQVLDRSYRAFISVSWVLIVFLCVVLAAFYLVYLNACTALYNIALLLLMCLLIIITISTGIAAALTAKIYCMKRAGRLEAAVLAPAIRFLAPLIMFVSAYMRVDGDCVRKFFIESNNILVSSLGRKYRAGELLVLLPHCLQSTECNCRVTLNMENCKECGKCDIGSLKALTRDKGINAAVVTGGTAARNIVKDWSPKAIVSVACERDLYSGIMDVLPIPSLGVLNERPNGPCNNTKVDVKRLENCINKLIE